MVDLPLFGLLGWRQIFEPIFGESETSMKCPYCGHSDDRVLDTREQREGAVIRRRRECLNCKGRFSTQESLSLILPYVIKKDGRREPFDAAKVLRGIQAACQKRPISLSTMESIVERISTWAMGFGEKEVLVQRVGQKVMEELKKLDEVAYIRFASVYRTFRDVQEFVETLETQPQQFKFRDYDRDFEEALSSGPPSIEKSESQEAP